QQKYCDQGRSEAVFSTTDVPSAQLLRVWRKAQKRIDLAIDEKLLLRSRRVDHPAYIFARVEPDLRGHQRNQHVRGRSEAQDSDPFPLEVADGCRRLRSPAIRCSRHARPPAP